MTALTAANDNTTSARAFVVGTTYATRSACDYDCIFRFPVVARTAKTITIETRDGKRVRRGVRLSGGVEHCNPMGSYSMAPVISADKVLS